MENLIELYKSKVERENLFTNLEQRILKFIDILIIGNIMLLTLCVVFTLLFVGLTITDQVYNPLVFGVLTSFDFMLLVSIFEVIIRTMAYRKKLISKRLGVNITNDLIDVIREYQQNALSEFLLSRNEMNLYSIDNYIHRLERRIQNKVILRNHYYNTKLRVFNFLSSVVMTYITIEVIKNIEEALKMIDFDSLNMELIILIVIIFLIIALIVKVIEWLINYVTNITDNKSSIEALKWKFCEYELIEVLELLKIIINKKEESNNVGVAS